jgi:hypothetical protein
LLKSGDRNGCVALPLGGLREAYSAGDDIVLLPTTCNSNATLKKAVNATSLSSAFCEVGCPFNQTDQQSPCLFRSHPLSIDQSSCSSSDFDGGWVLSSVFGGIHDRPSIECAVYIRRYCTAVAGRRRAAGGESADPACSLQAIQHLLHDIPKCPQREPPSVSEGMFARVVVLALVPRLNATAGSTAGLTAGSTAGSTAV